MKLVEVYGKTIEAYSNKQAIYKAQASSLEQRADLFDDIWSSKL